MGAMCSRRRAGFGVRRPISQDDPPECRKVTQDGREPIPEDRDRMRSYEWCDTHDSEVRSQRKALPSLLAASQGLGNDRKRQQRQGEGRGDQPPGAKARRKAHDTFDVRDRLEGISPRPREQGRTDNNAASSPVAHIRTSALEEKYSHSDCKCACLGGVWL